MLLIILFVSSFLITMTGSQGVKHEVTKELIPPVIEIIEEEVNLINGKIDNREQKSINKALEELAHD